MESDIIQIVEEILGEENLNLDEDLIYSGKLNSILVVEIIEKLEQKYEVSLDEANLTNESFRTLRNILKLFK